MQRKKRLHESDDTVPPTKQAFHAASALKAADEAIHEIAHTVSTPRPLHYKPQKSP
jgi:hypothetical protein